MRRCVLAAAAACLLLLAACAQGETKAWEGELLAMDTIMKRSEERRVGKECRL